MLRKLCTLILLCAVGCTTIDRAGYALKPDLTEREAKTLPSAELEPRLPFNHPVVLYIYAIRLLQEGKQDEGAFWFYAAQLRGKVLLATTKDHSLGSLLSAYNSGIGNTVNARLAKDPNKWTSLIDEVLKWDLESGNKSTPYPNHKAVYDSVRTGLVELKSSIREKYGGNKAG